MEKFKIVKVKDREYRIENFRARDGAFVVMKVAGILAPIVSPLLQGQDVKGINSPSDVKIENFDIAKVLGPLSSISEEDFDYLQAKSLSVVKVKLPSGFVSVVNGNGSYAIEELEDDGMLLMTLMVHAIMHNLLNFFGGNLFEGLLGAIQGTN